jgi:hypothetical protein
MRKNSVYVYILRKTPTFSERTNGGKPVQGHGPVARNYAAKGEFTSKKCSNMF